ncbi:MAG TPA: sulfatase-like hydrolase/transferase [Thermoanaerobaculia bacterium]|nr:sulfatase-like hydrolase/transferase [Thermoanaerobaculia bacterium]
MNHFLLLVLDSCRYDSVADVWPSLQWLPRLGQLERAYSHATWTLPSHFDFLAGRLPWKPTDKDTRYTRGAGRFHYEMVGELRRWSTRLGIDAPTIVSAQFEIRAALRQHGYRLCAITAAGPIGANTYFSEMVDRHVDVGSKGDSFLRGLDHLDFTTPSFTIFNTWETHYPFWTPGYDAAFEDRVMSGLRGLAQAAMANTVPPDVFFTNDELAYLHERQRNAVRYIDSLIPQLLARIPENCTMVITADHGEAFGEDGFVGHGEVAHRVVLEVPFIEVTLGALRRVGVPPA